MPLRAGCNAPGGDAGQRPFGHQILGQDGKAIRRQGGGKWRKRPFYRRLPRWHGIAAARSWAMVCCAVPMQGKMRPRCLFIHGVCAGHGLV